MGPYRTPGDVPKEPALPRPRTSFQGRVRKVGLWLFIVFVQVTYAYLLQRR